MRRPWLSNEMTAYYDNIPDDADEDSTVSMTYVDAVSLPRSQRL